MALKPYATLPVIQCQYLFHDRDNNVSPCTANVSYVMIALGVINVHMQSSKVARASYRIITATKPRCSVKRSHAVEINIH